MKKSIVSLLIMILAATGAFTQEMNITKNLEIWLKADALSGIKDGDAIGAWADASANKADFSSPTLVKRPIFKANFANGKPGLAFSGAQGMTTSKKYSLKDFTVFIVFKDDGIATEYERLVDHNYANGFWTGRNKGETNSWGGGIKASDTPYGNFTAFSDSTPNLMIFCRKGDVQSIFGSCASPVQGNVSDGSTAEGPITVGCWNDMETNQNQWLTGQIAEVLIYSVALSDADLKNVGTYLRNKYAIK